MNELDDLFERGRRAQRKSVEGILEFAACVKELKDRALKDQGGTSFTKDCKREWGIDHNIASKWLAIGNRSNINKFINVLPTTTSALFEITKLTDSQLDQAVVTGVIKPNTPAKKIVEYQAKLINEEIKANARAVVVQKVNDGIVSIEPTNEQLENALYEHKKEVFKHKKVRDLVTLLTESKWAFKELLMGYESDTLNPAQLHIINGLGGKLGGLVDEYRRIKQAKLKLKEVVNLDEYKQLEG